MNIPKEEFRLINGDSSWIDEHGDGYRIVYFDDQAYHIGAYCPTIEGIMCELNECDPIIDESAIPAFISVDDMLSRILLSTKNVTSIALYTTDGVLVGKSEKTKNLNNK